MIEQLLPSTQINLEIWSKVSAHEDNLRFRTGSMERTLSFWDVL